MCAAARTVVVALTMLAMSAVSAWAADTGTVSGAAFDQLGQPIADATVTVSTTGLSSGEHRWEVIVIDTLTNLFDVVSGPDLPVATALTDAITVTRTVGIAVQAISSPVCPWTGGPSESSSGRTRNFATE